MTSTNKEIYNITFNISKSTTDKESSLNESQNVKPAWLRSINNESRKPREIPKYNAFQPTSGNEVVRSISSPCHETHSKAPISDRNQNVHQATTRSTRTIVPSRVVKGVPAGFNPRSSRLPQVSTNKSKNDMSAPPPNRICPENIFDNEYLIASTLEGATDWMDDWEDLINFRRTCTLYASVGVMKLKRDFVYRITKRFALYWWQTFLDYLPEEVPAVRYNLNPKWLIASPIDIHGPESNSKNTEDIMKNILQKIGHHLIYLKLDDFTVDRGLATLRNILFVYAPKMNQLILSRPTFVMDALKHDILENGGPFYDPVSEMSVPKLAEVPLILPHPFEPRPRLTVFHYRAVRGSWFPLHWLEVFFGFPNLQDLKINDVCSVEMEEILTALVSDKLPRPLTLKKLNAFYTWDRRSESPLPELMPLYMSLKFQLTHLDICVTTTLDLLEIRNFIMNHCETLEHLVLTRASRSKRENNFELIFKYAYLGSLKYFEATNDMFHSFSFLQVMPHLEKLVMNDSDPTDPLPGIIYAELFSSPKKNEEGDTMRPLQFVAENLTEVHLSSVDFPKFQDKTITYDLVSTFPKLSTLRINDMNNTQLRAIFSGLFSLRLLTIYGTRVVITDGGIIGTDDKPLQKYVEDGKTKLKREFPYIGQLKFLRSFVIDHQMAEPLKITKLSLDWGLADCENLNQVILFGTCVKMEDARSMTESQPICTFRVNRDWKK